MIYENPSVCVKMIFKCDDFIEAVDDCSRGAAKSFINDVSVLVTCANGEVVHPLTMSDGYDGL